MEEQFVPPVINSNEPTGLTPAPDKKKRSKAPFVWSVVVVLVLGAGIGAFWWRNDQAVQQQAAQESKISDLERQIEELSNAQTEPAGESDMSEGLTEADRDSIEEAVTSDNTAALEGYMAETVTVIIAASDGVGPRTPTEAIADLAYIADATDPWNFALDAATLAEYKTGDYTQYFSDDSIVGVSADNKVVVFNFDSAGKIDGIFMAIDAGLL